MFVIPATWEAVGRSFIVQGCPRKKHKTLFEKYLNAKRAGDMPEVVEHLPKCELLSSNPNTKKKEISYHSNCSSVHNLFFLSDHF
jgi:hypothetical protein